MKSFAVDSCLGPLARAGGLVLLAATGGTVAAQGASTVAMRVDGATVVVSAREARLTFAPERDSVWWWRTPLREGGSSYAGETGLTAAGPDMTLRLDLAHAVWSRPTVTRPIKRIKLAANDTLISAGEMFRYSVEAYDDRGQVVEGVVVEVDYRTASSQSGSTCTRVGNRVSGGLAWERVSRAP